MAPNCALRVFFNFNKRVNLAVSAVSSRFYGSTTDPNILKSPYEDVDIPRMTIPELVFSKIGKWRNHIATEGKPTPQGAISLQEVFQTKIDLSDMSLPNPDDVALMPYSSGTTGLPKGVLLTHSNIVSNFIQLSVPDIEYYAETTNDHQDVVPSILPFFHAAGLNFVMLQSILKGSRNVCIPKFQPQGFIEMLIKYKPDMLPLTPPLVMFIATDATVKSNHLASLRSIVCGAAPLKASDEERFLEKANRNTVLGQAYGMTEATSVLTLTPKNVRVRTGSSGPPVPNTEIKIVDQLDPLRPSLGPNQKGELVARGPQIMKGYHNKPEETKKTLVDGWLQSGDIGYYDEAGNLMITDRLKELIKVNSFQVAPAELEGVLRDYPDVIEAGVIGIPHERYGEVPKAYVTLKPGVKFNEEKLKEFVKSKVVSYKELKGGISVIDSLPKNPSGKILRRKLQEYYEQHQI